MTNTATDLFIPTARDMALHRLTATADHYVHNNILDADDPTLDGLIAACCPKGTPTDNAMRGYDAKRLGDSLLFTIRMPNGGYESVGIGADEIGRILLTAYAVHLGGYR